MALFLGYLPRELMLQVVKHLDYNSACALARTCKALQAVAEVAIYSGLALSNPSVCTPSSDIRLFARRKLDAIRRKLYMDEPDRHMSASFQYAKLMRKVVGFLHTHPLRRTSITTLQIDYENVCPRKLQELLETLAPTLKHLEVNKPRHGLTVPMRAGWVAFTEMITSMKAQLSSLRSLNYCYDEDWDARLFALLQKAPNLVELRLIANSQYSGGWGERALLEREEKGRCWPQLRLLRVLQVDEMDGHLCNLLIRLVTGASDLECVRLHDISLVWQPNAGDPLLQALGESRSLKYLDVSSAGRSACDFKNGFKALEVLFEGDVMVEEAPLLSTVLLPTLPRLKHFMHWCRESPAGTEWPYDAFTRCIPAAVEPLPPSLLQQIASAPGLEFIRLNEIGSTEGNPADWQCPTEYWTSEKALHNSERALLIRTYVSENGLTFTHCRGFNTREPGDKYADPRNVLSLWQEYSDFQGECVGTDLLNQVYVLLGEPKEWLETGRELALPSAAWELLEMHLKASEALAPEHEDAERTEDIEATEAEMEYLRIEA